MPRPCSDDLRMRAGKSRRSVEKQFRAAASTVIERFQRYSNKESVRPSRIGSVWQRIYRFRAFHQGPGWFRGLGHGQ